MAGARLYSYDALRLREQARCSPRRGTVLVVDDEASVLHMVQEILEDEKLRVLTAREGHEALTIAQRLQPDLIITDLMMPGMNGQALRKHLLQDPRTARIPVVLMSAAYQLQGGNDFAGLIAKPFDIDQLLAQVEQHLPAR